MSVFDNEFDRMQESRYYAYKNFVNDQLFSVFGIPARYFEPMKFDYKSELVYLEKSLQKDSGMTKFSVEWFVDGAWKERIVKNSATEAMNYNQDIIWSNGPEGMKWGVDSDGYLYRIVVKKPQWTAWRRSPLASDWSEVIGCDTITEGTSKLARNGFTIIWASVTDSNQCYGVDRNGNAFKIERTK